MFECLIIGDSIAVGTKMFMPDCLSHSRGGITSWKWESDYSFADLTTAKTVIISLGSNDGKTGRTVDALMAIRSRVEAKKVIWVLPIAAGHDNVIYVAKKFGDQMIEIKYPQRDNIHPSWRGYRAIAEEARK